MRYKFRDKIDMPSVQGYKKHKRTKAEKAQSRNETLRIRHVVPAKKTVEHAPRPTTPRHRATTAAATATAAAPIQSRVNCMPLQ